VSTHPTRNDNASSPRHSCRRFLPTLNLIFFVLALMVVLMLVLGALFSDPTPPNDPVPRHLFVITWIATAVMLLGWHGDRWFRNRTRRESGSHSTSLAVRTGLIIGWCLMQLSLAAVVASLLMLVMVVRAKSPITEPAADTPLGKAAIQNIRSTEYSATLLALGVSAVATAVGWGISRLVHSRAGTVPTTPTDPSGSA
jgi:hypothetical protein